MRRITEPRLLALLLLCPAALACGAEEHVAFAEEDASSDDGSLEDGGSSGEIESFVDELIDPATSEARDAHH